MYEVWTGALSCRDKMPERRYGKKYEQIICVSGKWLDSIMQNEGAGDFLPLFYSKVLYEFSW